MKFNHQLVALGIACAVAAPEMALAQEQSTLPISGNLTFTTDYVFRGVSQTNEDFAVQGGIDYAHQATGLYVGTWASNVSFAPGSVELDVYGGWARAYGDFVVKIGALHYDYPGNSSLNTDELVLGGSWKWFSASYYYALSDEYFGLLDGKGSQYLELNASYELPMEFVIGAHYGTTLFDGEPTPGSPNDANDYVDWKISVARSYRGLDFLLAYTDTDFDKGANAPADIADERVFLSVTKTF